jgi:O6-methylguanine-DNA--protein-cysteine methyltransferase
VIGSDGTLVGYSGGLDRKETLLETEGFPVQKEINLMRR